MTTQDAALDEVQWFSPEWVQHFGGIHENTVLYYFARSPFCEATSNNSSIETQAMYNPSMLELLATRETFETHLKTLQGLEYIVAMSPRDFGGERAIGQGTWVIRKQNRRKRLGAEDEVTILATYFVVGEHIYMAPSVSNILQARLLSTVYALKKVIATASTLPMYTPALGHRYFTPSASAKSGEDAQLPQTTQQSREDTPMPEVPAQQEGAAKEPLTVPAMAGGTAQSSVASTQALYESFPQFLRFGNEYMDDNPLLGEPGKFVFSSSRQHLQAQQEQAAKKSEQTATATKLHTDVKGTETTPQPSRPVTPQPLPARQVKLERKQSTAVGVPKPKRRKSRAPATPGSPLSATTPISPS